MASRALAPGFTVEVDEDGRIWVFRTGEPAEKSEKHITRVGAGPMGSTLKALDRDRQIAVFEGQLRLAQKHDLPVVLHCRKAHEQILASLKRIT